MNKHASMICFVPGKPITKEDAATGDIKVVGKGADAIGFEFQGTFHRK